MPSTHRFAAILAIVFGLASSACPQAPDGKKDAFPKLLKGFEKERAEAVAQGFSETELKAADEILQRAKGFRKAGNEEQARIALRQSRYALPYLPADIPAHVSKVIGIPRLHQPGIIEGIALHPKDPLCAAAGADGAVLIWNLENGRLTRSYSPAGKPSRAVAWSPDGKWIASGSGHDVHIWEADTGKTRHILKEHKADICSLSFSADGKTLASTADSPDRSILLWDAATGEKTGLVAQEKARIFQLAFQPKQNALGIVDGNGLFKLYPAAPWSKDAPSRESFSRKLHTANGAFALAFTPDGQAVFTGGGDNSIKLTFVGNYQKDASPSESTTCKLDSTAGHAQQVTALSVSPDGKYLASGGKEGIVKIWNLQQGTLLRTLYGHEAEISGLAFTADSRTLVSGSHDQRIRVWDVSPTDSHVVLNDQKGFLWTCAYSPDGKHFATGGSDNQVCLYDAATNKLIAKIPAHSSAVTALVFSPDSARLYTSGGDRLMKSWTVPGGKPVATYTGHTGPIMALAIDSGGKYLLTGSADKTAILWDGETAKPLATFGGLNSAVSAVDFAPRGKWLAIGTADGTLRIFQRDAPTKEEFRVQAHTSGIACLQFAPNSPAERPVIATAGGDHVIRFWSRDENGKFPISGEIAAHANAISAIAYDKSGESLASAGGDQFVKIWNAKSRVEKSALRGHTEWVTSVAFSPDDSALLSVGVDKTARIWSLPYDDSLKAVGHSRQVTAVSASAAGLVASASDDRTVRIWEAKSGREVAILPVNLPHVTSLLLMPDGKSVLVAGFGDINAAPSLNLWDIEQKKIVKQIPDAEKFPMQVPMMVMDAGRKRILIWSLRRTGEKPVNRLSYYDIDLKPLGALPEKEIDSHCCCFSQDGSQAAFGTIGGMVRVWDIEKQKKFFKDDLKASAKDIQDVCFAKDGLKLYTADADGVVKLWNLKEGKEEKSMKTAGADGTHQLLASEDGKALIFYNTTGEVLCLDPATLEKRREWKLPTRINAASLSSDGKSLVTGNADSTIYFLELP